MKIDGVIETTIQPIPGAYQRTTAETIKESHQLIIKFTGTEAECKIIRDLIFAGKFKGGKNCPTAKPAPVAQDAP